jgi:hypothetical protein
MNSPNKYVIILLARVKVARRVVLFAFCFESYDNIFVGSTRNHATNKFIKY